MQGVKKEHKQCIRCKKIKTVSEFNKHKRESDGLQVYCKSCKKEYRIEKANAAKQMDTVYFNPNTSPF